MPASGDASDGTSYVEPKALRYFYCLNLRWAAEQPREFIWLWVYIVLVALMAGVGVFVAYDPSWIQVGKTNFQCRPALVVARMNALNLDLGIALLVALMLPRTLTFLRTSPIGRFCPLDDVVAIHRLIGFCATGYALLHFTGHMAHDYCLSHSANANFTFVELAFTRKPGIGWFYGSSSISGWILLSSHTIMFFGTLVRRGNGMGRFEVFYFTHLLYIVYITALLLHSDKFWAFIAVPIFLFIIEKLSMAFGFLHRRHGEEFLTRKAVVWPNVVELRINRPPGFDFRAGDYVFINLPQLAKFEWHPFTISSAPERLGEWTLHIRSAGDWTRALNKLFAELTDAVGQPLAQRKMTMAPPTDGMQLGLPANRDSSTSVNSVNLSVIQAEQRRRRQVITARSYGASMVEALRVPLNVIGPYGAPSSSVIYRSEHAILVSAGIGVTPFLSILQSVALRFEQSTISCPRCQFTMVNPVDIAARMRLVKVDFIWLVHDGADVQWALKLLSEVEQLQDNLAELRRFVDMRIYVTAAGSQEDLSAFALITTQALVDLEHRQLGTMSLEDISGMRNPAYAGRPDWDELFEEINEQRQSTVASTDVFFCGPLPLARIVRRSAMQAGFTFHKEEF